MLFIMALCENFIEELGTEYNIRKLPLTDGVQFK